MKFYNRKQKLNMFAAPPSENPHLLHVNMIAQQQQICLAHDKNLGAFAQGFNFDKELKNIEYDLKIAKIKAQKEMNSMINSASKKKDSDKISKEAKKKYDHIVRQSELEIKQKKAELMKIKVRKEAEFKKMANQKTKEASKHLKKWEKKAKNEVAEKFD